MPTPRVTRALAALFSISAIAATVGCSSPVGDPEADNLAVDEICPDEETTGSLTLGMGQAIPVFAPFLLAEATNAFEAAGLDVTIEPIPTADGLPLLAQGELDGQITSYTSANFNVVNEGVNLKFIAPLDQQVEAPVGTPMPGFWGRKDQVGEAGDLDLTAIEGGTVVGPTGTRGISAKILQDALEPFGMGLDDVDTGEIMQSPDGLIALENGAVDLAWITSPLEVEAARNSDLVPVAGYAPGVTGTTFLAGPSLLGEPELAVRLLQVLQGVTEEYLTGDYRENDETVALLAEAQGVSEETIREAEPLSFDPDFAMDGVGDFLEELQVFLQQEGDLDYEDPLSMDEVIDTRFSEALASCAPPE